MLVKHLFKAVAGGIPQGIFYTIMRFFSGGAGSDLNEFIKSGLCSE
jgi:hypothetical protein